SFGRCSRSSTTSPWSWWTAKHPNWPIAAAQLADALKSKPQLFKTVQQPQRGPFFDRNGLLLPLAEFRATGEGLARAQPLLASLAADPSFGGVLATLSNSLQDVKYGAGEARRHTARDDGAG